MGARKNLPQAHLDSWLRGTLAWIISWVTPTIDMFVDFIIIFRLAAFVQCRMSYAQSIPFYFLRYFVTDFILRQFCLEQRQPSPIARNDDKGSSAAEHDVREI